MGVKIEIFLLLGKKITAVGEISNFIVTGEKNVSSQARFEILNINGHFVHRVYLAEEKIKKTAAGVKFKIFLFQG